MTNWLPDITEGDGPIYLRLADSIEGAISDGTLQAGSKLPPQRNLAYDLGVTIGTISRAYALIHERGLVSGEVGRGTYVNERKTPAPSLPLEPAAAAFGSTRHAVDSSAEFRLNTTAAPDVGQSLLIARHIEAVTREHTYDITNYARSFPDSWCMAGVRWLSQNGWSPKPENIVSTLGAHAAVMSVITAMTAPGDRIVFEPLTYSHISRSATLAGRRVTLVEADENGIVPDDFERVCAQQHPKMIFLMSAGQNPTCATLPEERRRAIADIARRYGVWIVEDNLYGAMTREAIPLIAEFAPDITFVVGGLSKSVAAGVRGGWVACPAQYSSRIRISHSMITGGLPFMLAELNARLVNSGDAHDIRKDCIAELNGREAIARRVFAGLDFNSLPDIAFMWLRLPEPWLSGTFRNAAMKEGVLIDDEDEFKAGRAEKVFHRVRISFSGPSSREELTHAFGILRHLLDNGSAGYESVA
ncbi:MULTISPECIES: PLP-dependent aminotransferase family protein [Rhizobium/Agrobacterium group]|uniref:PLP-dependent aminotransferase family protein n=1 Tax=Agrobacterium tumefaciens TaxID=358 RepID=A0A546XYW2_AGRTU|nr:MULTISPECIES: PLP-dependent aminotransferase family protein [Rhizobium/Agrobacterium group]MBO0124851.1 PLP-dependent aminotransferase family protein [Agrobacterium sp. OT33]NSX90985.1 PLP-dependent aminotransferase family protein [Agrobacterium tumefaciens]NTE55226.1 PLP-dependent aminotransferase family protein [Agrobacterium tumefaciens]NTE71756.1 PLP-dependent aminotransferase family protein [Agrobacterium tumefaciens]PYG59853.1 GntR family transcriptional regulator [Rhizobium sp. UGM03